MNRERKRLVALDCLKKHRGAIAVFFLMSCGGGTVFCLYGLPLEPFLYVFLLTAFTGTVLFVLSLARNIQRAEKRERLKNTLLANPEAPEAELLSEADYQEMIRILLSECRRIESETLREQRETEDYLNAWVHQIKTPIAVMRMELGELEPEAAKNLSAELFRIEGYVEMVLQYRRLTSGTGDYVFRSVSLDEMIRASIRKFASQFLLRHLSVRYEGTEETLVTDEKWYCCILDQLLSNAIKYTPKGSVTITAEKGCVCIRDTGIGIAPEDQPRVFEKGFTGQNGRLDKQASGLGLYLAATAAERLNLELSLESEPGRGSAFFIAPGRKNDSSGTIWE